MATLEDYLPRLRAVHGDTYQYLRLETKGWNFSIVAVCSGHGEFKQGLHNHLKGRGCNLCERQSRKPKLADWIKRFRAVHGDRYRYLDVVETGTNFSVKYVCAEHGDRSQVAYDHLKGNGCGACAFEGTRRTFAEWVGLFQEVHGDRFKYLSMTRAEAGWYSVEAICPVHGPITLSANSHIKGAGCQKCGRTVVGQKNKLSEAEVTQKAAEVHRGRYAYNAVLNIGEGNDMRLLVVCSIHGEYSQRAWSHLEGKGCPRCRGPVSGPNLEIEAMLNASGVITTLEQPILGTRKRMDVYCEASKVGIEYHGNIWHSTKWQRSKDSHLVRLQQAKAAGVRLIQIFSDEWAYSRSACELLIKRAAGVPEEAINARACKVVDVAHSIASEFYTKWHIQGATSKSSRYVGLESGGYLVAVMGFSFNTSSRREKATGGRAELTRYATCKNVRGGFSKLLRAWLRQHEAVQEVVSYSDNRLFTGRMYEACGFVKDQVTGIDYSYLDQKTDKRLHKSRFQKSRLRVFLGTRFSPELTEKQMTEQAGYYRVYDCGKTRWVYRR